jgi:thiamine biosynthesis lipoprotein
LDLGATAKAWTADRSAALVAQRLDTAALVEIGGDLAVGGAPEGGWRVHVAEREGEPGQDIGVHAGGVATSTTTVRAWQRDRRPMHHLIDPRTGEPTRGAWRTVTVADESALAANTATTAALVLGDVAEPWLIHRGAPARLVHRDGSVVHLGDWPVDGLQAA